MARPAREERFWGAAEWKKAENVWWWALARFPKHSLGFFEWWRRPSRVATQVCLGGLGVRTRAMGPSRPGQRPVGFGAFLWQSELCTPPIVIKKMLRGLSPGALNIGSREFSAVRGHARFFLENPWAAPEIHENPCKFMNIHGNS